MPNRYGLEPGGPVSLVGFSSKRLGTNGSRWSDRFYAVQAGPDTSVRIMSEALGPSPADASPFERCNLWLLYSALACGVEKVRFVCLWNGAGGDGPGGTAHMYDEVRRRTGRVDWIDSRTLDPT